MSVRRLNVLLKGLPDDAATIRERHPAAAWSTEGHLLASVLDAIHALTWTTIEVNRSKGRKNPYPEPITRPGEASTHTNGHAPKVDGLQLAGWLKGG